MLRLVVVSLCCLLGGCKYGPGGDQQQMADVQIKRVDQEGAAARLDWGLLDLSEDGRPEGKLILGLDMITGEPHSGNLPRCYEPLASDVVLGELACVSAQMPAFTLKIAGVYQDCYTNPKFELVPPSEPIQIPGCERAQVYGFSFEPQLRVDIERL